MNVGWYLYQIFARSGTRMTESRSDAYGYNDRTELTNAVKNATLNTPTSTTTSATALPRWI